MSYYDKHAFDFERYQLRIPAGLLIARFAIMIALTCLVATFVMLIS